MTLAGSDAIAFGLMVLGALIIVDSPYAKAPEGEFHPWRIDLKIATEAELTLLPHVGPVIAERLHHAIETGVVWTPDDLTKVRGIGPLTQARSRYLFKGAEHDDAPR